MIGSNADQAFGDETGRGKRFQFGANWSRFLNTLDDRKISRAKESLQSMTGRDGLISESFLDIGSGSGLFSLAARMLGARVYSFDYDPESVRCTMELKKRYFPGDPGWDIEQASILDEALIKVPGRFDIVYSWGVLHHTGNLRRALENAAAFVKPDGLLCLSIYNDQGWPSDIWKFIKKTYNHMPGILRWAVLLPCFVRLRGPMLIKGLLKGHPLRYWKEYSSDRGMSPWHDVVDWVGGWPFEVARPEEIFDFFFTRGFQLIRLKTCAGGKGCNEFVFKRIVAQA